MKEFDCNMFAYASKPQGPTDPAWSWPSWYCVKPSAPGAFWVDLVKLAGAGGLGKCFEIVWRCIFHVFFFNGCGFGFICSPGAYENTWGDTDSHVEVCTLRCV